MAALADGKPARCARRLATLGGLLVLVAAGPAAADLEIHHFNVGQGDATLLRDTATGRSLLIDAGNRGVGERVLAPALTLLAATEITYFLATHYDADHIGGFDELLANGIRISEQIFDRGGETTDRTLTTASGNVTQYGEYVAAAGGLRTTLAASCAPSPIVLGADTRIDVVAAAGSYLRGPRIGEAEACHVERRTIAKSKDNDLSIALLVRHGRFSYYIGGDLTGGGNSTTPMERFAAPWIADVDVLKVDHHGSATSSDAAFLEALQPEVVIISVGDGGVNLRYRLPRQDVLDRIAGLKSKPRIFLTNRGEGGRLADSFVENRHVVLWTSGDAYMVNGLLRAVDEFPDESPD